MNPLTMEGVRSLAAQSAGGRFLAGFVLVCPDSAEDEAVFYVVCNVVYARDGGFMFVAPNFEGLKVILISLAAGDGLEEPGFHEASVDIETPRGRPLGKGLALFVDVPWGMASHFLALSALRSQSLRDCRVEHFVIDGTKGRPAKDAAFIMADGWIADNMEDVSAQEYLTGQEADGDDELQPDGVHQQGQQDPTVTQLLARVAELEQQAAVAKHLQEQGGGMVPALPGKPARAPPLFGSPGQAMSPDAWEKIQRLAGSPPARVGATEKKRAAPLKTRLQDSALLDMEREAEELEQGEAALATIAASASDPIQQLLAAQMQQNQVLIRRLVGAQKDPLLGALGGSDSGSGNSGGGNVKGCIAREIFVRAMNDLPKVSLQVRANALRELGFTPDREDGSLMRRYIERRMSLGDNRVWAIWGTMLAEGWAVGYESGNHELLGVLSKMLCFLEQMSIDNGRTQLAYLLTGYAEPSMHLMMTSKRRPGLQPFSRLAPPSWVSANLAYLKDLDFLESRSSTLTRMPKPTVEGDEDEEKRPKPKKGAKGGKKGGENEAGS